MRPGEAVGTIGDAEWDLRFSAPEPPLSLGDISYDAGRMSYTAHRHREPASLLADYLAEAKAMLALPPRTDLPIDHPDLDPEFELLRWFPLPAEVA